MSTWFQVVLTALTSVAASSGFWAYMDRRRSAKGALMQLVLGIAYGKILEVGMRYIERGWISTDEYEEFRKYLYEPYAAAGGNGVAQRIMEDISHLPFRDPNRYVETNHRGDLHERFVERQGRQ